MNRPYRSSSGTFRTLPLFPRGRTSLLHLLAQLMPLPLTVSCFSKIQIVFTFLVPAHLVVPEKGPLNG